MRTRRLALLSILVAAVGFATHAHAAARCDGSLWQHVHQPARLIQHGCISVAGTIVDATAGRRSDGMRTARDGDAHGWLRLDPQYRKLLNADNMSHQGGNLVFEIICYFPPQTKAAKAACQGYRSSVPIPPVGTHVRMTGTYVLDTGHAQWMEIHPVTSITIR